MIGWEFLEFHELADLFPLLSEEEQSDLADRIEAEGFDPSHPIVLFEGKILDGRNRWMACDALRMEGRLAAAPPFREFTGESALRFVLNENLHRRHLTDGQKAALAVEILPWEEKEARDRQGSRSDLGERIPPGSTGKARDKAAQKTGANPHYVSDAKKLKAEAPDLFESVRAGIRSIPQARRDLQQRMRPVLSAATPLPADKYSLILADPPWRYEHCMDREDAIENRYPTMDLQAICDLPVPDIAAADCILFLWTTSPKLEEAMRVVQAWGFSYRTGMVWHKSGLGMGHYIRVDHEHLLIAAKGRPGVPIPENRPRSVIQAAKGRHSEKPGVFRETIERMYPEAKRLELFARGEAPAGWTFWGNEALEEAA